MIVYSVTDDASFFRVPSLVKGIQGPSREDLALLLVGHKYDGENRRAVSKKEGREMAVSIGADFIEVNYKTGDTVAEAFRMLTTAFARPERFPAQMKLKISCLDSENKSLAYKIAVQKRSIKEKHKQEIVSAKRAREISKKVDRLTRQIEKSYPRVDEAVKAKAHARNEAYVAEQRLRECREHMVDMELRVRGIERRVGELQEQLRRVQGGATRGMRRRSFWVVGRGEIEATEEELGRGGWATVSVAYFRGLRVAAKRMHHDLVVCDYNRALFSREMSIAATMRHPNLVQFIGATLEGSPIILTELMATSLRAELEKQLLSPDQISSVSLDVARALLYLHLMQPDPIIHCDVSSANVLLNPGPEASWLAKLSDYGSANYVRHVTTRAPGNPSYAAPEADTPTLQSTKMDVFSYGVLLLEMWCRQTPEHGRHGALLHGLERGEVREMVGRCLQHNPARRPDMADLLQ